MRNLIRELMSHGIDDTTIRSVIMGLDNKSQYKEMAIWLKTKKDLTKNEILVKTYLMTEE